ncbi:PREDICTED: uncharacterized protein LOC109212164 [Nicotiana attenuata]|uniref:C2 domain-containing protein n=1 Tax=Nicotiana attenuata TaxID=49451 RepID=A0A314KJ82_NICAT|nr:PREDICTED: uncharacterized protein LOC109212164 [Nicotiana attenuata]XP_019231329.1 PREDICTED: uncharacterized protein LOC109212164 [Nicotiana attenuata]OIT28834.1 hypothetical protein A4A49_17194 [Nicotiana attenuata]
MEPQKIVTMAKSPVVYDPLKPKSDSIGVLDVYVHQARDIHNICIYHKQDVYAKIYLISYPEEAVSTDTINGGGKNPVFNQSLRLNVKSVETSVRCEIWMMSRVKNYLQDQLLGFTLVPLCDVLAENGKLEQEFSLSSSDLFHSPSGFVQLTLTYTGATPEVLEIPTPGHSLAAANDCDEGRGIADSIPCELVNIEFPDPKIVNENERMVTEYYSIPCTELDSQSSEHINSTENGDHISPENVERTSESAVVEGQDATEIKKLETSTRVSQSNSPSVCDTKQTSNSPIEESVLPLKDGSKDSAKEVDSTTPSIAVSTFTPPVVNVSIVPEQKVVQQEIVDMYMKSMQQFTEALAKMKLPLDMESGLAVQNGNDNTESSGSSEKPQARPSGQSPRVFYGSRAFF